MRATDPGPDARYAALAVPQRRRLFELVRSSSEPLAASDLAAAVGLHVTTARFHLDVLRRAGLVTRVPERRGRPGRPRQLYAGLAEGGEGAGADGGEGAGDAAGTGPPDAHRRLAAVLAEALAAYPDTGPERAEQAGRDWATQEVSAAETSWDAGTRRVGELFERLGFAPRLVDAGRRRHLELDGCPFREIARAHPQIVCAAHLGLLRGALSRLGLASGPDAAGLRPFVSPQLCVVDLAAPPPGRGPPA